MFNLVITRPKILAIFGSDKKLDLNKDKDILDELTKKGAKITWLLTESDGGKLTRQKLVNALLQESWDIVFFAGHSYSHIDLYNQQNGVIVLSENEEISLRELQVSLNQAANKGLKICIFNSCDGLYLARNCATYGIPNIIFMREPIPDQVAQDFLQNFLTHFSNARPLELALKDSQQNLVQKYPYLDGIEWLPTLYQNPASPPLIWKPTNPDQNKFILMGVASMTILLISLLVSQLYKKNVIPSIPSILSEGDRSLIKENQETSLIKQGNQAYQQGNFKLAQEKFQSSLQKNKNNPEVLIYLNNANSMVKNPLKLAAVVPIGSNVNIAQEMLRGVAQAQDEINKKGGINKRFLHITIVNDSNQPNISEDVAHILVKDSKILGVIGHNASNASFVAAPIYQKGGLVMVNPTSFANGIPAIGDYIFRTVPDVRYLAQLLAKYVTTRNPYTKLAVCYDFNGIDGISFQTQFMMELAANGGQPTFTSCNFNDPNFDPDQQIKDAIEQGSNSLLIIPFIDKLENSYKLAKANQGRLKLFGNSTLFTIKTLERGQYTQGLTVAVPWSPKNPSDQLFAKSARNLWGGDVTWRTAGAYDATYALITGLSKGQTRQTLQQALADPQFVSKTINGEVKFLPDGGRAGKAIILQVQPFKLNNNKTGYDFQLVSK